nr:hypothetical protein TEA_025849 [Ipomoea trifida]
MAERRESPSTVVVVVGPSPRLSPLITSDALTGDCYRVTAELDCRQGCEYWHSRRAFLNSYCFDRRQSRNIISSIDRVIERAAAVFLRIRRRMCGARVWFKYYKLTFSWPRVLTASCYVPCPVYV